MTRTLPCPQCGADVLNVRFEASDESYSAVKLTVAASRRRRYTLKPCGHEVQGYDATSTGKILRWYP